MSAVTAARTGTRGGRGARERILDAATTLFYRDGINTTGVDRLAAHANVSKRTLYKHFPSKTDLVTAYLCGIHDSGGYDTEQKLLDRDRTPRDQLLSLFEGQAGGRIRGCPFHNAAVEAVGEMPGAESVVHKHKREFVDSLSRLALDAGATEPGRLANQLAILFEGAAALATSMNSSEPFPYARAAAAALIDQAIAHD